MDARLFHLNASNSEGSSVTNDVELSVVQVFTVDSLSDFTVSIDVGMA